MTQSRDARKEPLSKDDRRYALILGVPTFALALCLTTLSTYLPVLAHRFTSSTSIIGLLVGGEGLVAVLLPVWIGRLSDHTHTRFGPRLPFLIATAPIAALALGLMPFAPSLWLMAVLVFIFYLAYFTYFSPYRALYPDLISKSANARAQGIQGVFNGAGVGLALISGGLLISLWRPSPYLLSGAVLLAATVFAIFTLYSATKKTKAFEPTESSPFHDLWSLLKDDGDIRRFVLGNALLTLGLGGLKSFVVLWLTAGLGKSMAFTSGAMAVVAAGTIVGALISGKLGDRYGPGKVLPVSLAIFGAGLAVGTFSTAVPVLAVAFPFIALSGGAAVALPYALLLELTPTKKHGIVAGLFDASSGLGTLLGPTLTGLSIDVLGSLFPASHGYAAMWPVLSLSALGGALVLRNAGKAPAHAKQPATAQA